MWPPSVSLSVRPCACLSSVLILLTDEVVSVGAVSLDPVVLQRPVEQQTVHPRRWRGAVDGRCSCRSPARVTDWFEMMLRRPHPLLIAHHEVAARPPTVDILILCACGTHYPIKVKVKVKVKVSVDLYSFVNTPLKVVHTRKSSVGLGADLGFRQSVHSWYYAYYLIDTEYLLLTAITFRQTRDYLSSQRTSPNITCLVKSYPCHFVLYKLVL